MNRFQMLIQILSRPVRLGRFVRSLWRSRGLWVPLYLAARQGLVNGRESERQFLVDNTPDLLGREATPEEKEQAELRMKVAYWTELEERYTNEGKFDGGAVARSNRYHYQRQLDSWSREEAES